jgi:hypothetical protein
MDGGWAERFPFRRNPAPSGWLKNLVGQELKSAIVVVAGILMMLSTLMVLLLALFLVFAFVFPLAITVAVAIAVPVPVALSFPLTVSVSITVTVTIAISVAITVAVVVGCGSPAALIRGLELDTAERPAGNCQDEDPRKLSYLLHVVRFLFFGFAGDCWFATTVRASSSGVVPSYFALAKTRLAQNECWPATEWPLPGNGELCGELR